MVDNQLNPMETLAHKLQKENGINIKNFEGEEDDTELYDLIPDLKNLVEDKVYDVRKVLPEIINKMNKRNHEKDLNN